jgi:pyruvate-ferredoxin/flavodoxin oxidoreductase
MLARANPEASRAFLDQAQKDINERYHRYEQLAGLSWSAVEGPSVQSAPTDAEQATGD